MITSQQAIDKTIEIVSAAFPSISGETGSSHFYGDIQIDEHLFVKFRVANHGIYIQTLISHANGIPPELKETISIVYRNSTTEPIGTKTTTKGYEPTIVVMQYVYPCWDMYLPDVAVVANEIISFLKTGEFKPPFICTKDVLVQYVESDSGVKDVTKQFRDYYCPKKEIEQKTVQLKESDLRTIVKETLIRVLCENYNLERFGEWNVVEGTKMLGHYKGMESFGLLSDKRLYDDKKGNAIMVFSLGPGSISGGVGNKVICARLITDKKQRVLRYQPLKKTDVPQEILRDLNKRRFNES